jgi:hypothetical protein
MPQRVLRPGKITVPVPSSVTIVRLSPLSAKLPLVPQPPTDLAATTTENSVHVVWHPAKSRVAGYFVFRNGAFVAATASTSYDDDSAWNASAPDYATDSFNGNLAFSWAPVPGGFSSVYTIKYRAASANQKLTVTWALDAEPNRFLGQARLQAATLGAD